MLRAKAGSAAALAALCVVAAAAPAHAAKSCQAPKGDWERATPAEEGMDAAKLQDAMDYGTSQLSFAVRVYRRGCLVAEDREASHNRTQTYESWSMAKSVTALIFGRAMTLGLISPDDPVGALFPEADKPHGAITMRDLLTQTSGLRWNGLRDYNIFTMPDRIRDALTLEIAHKPGTYFEYAQSPVSLLAAAIGRATGSKTPGVVQSFAQRELFDQLGIPADRWFWNHDSAGNVGGFWGVNMRPDDFGRLGELMRRGGVWRGRRLLSKRFIAEAIAPSPTNGCYAWLIWVNAAAPCVGVTISERPVRNSRDLPDLPADMYRFSGLFGQLVTVFPTQDLLVVRTGQDPGLVFAGGSDWEHELYTRILGSITDQQIVPPGPPPTGPPQQNADYGFQNSIREPDQYSKGSQQDPLPPAGPGRARAARLRLAGARAQADGTVLARIACPPRWTGTAPRECAGSATLTGARRALAYRLTPGRNALLHFRLTKARLSALRRARTATLELVATNRDPGGGTPARLAVTVTRP
jgi:CubicO group peptidase (beta-lactamase class C family)